VPTVAILSSCYSGSFTAMRAANRVIITAARADRPSFGCQAGNDWTLFGTALINHAFRQPLPLEVQFQRAKALIGAAEEQAGLEPSNPQVSIGPDTAGWRGALDARAPKVASAPVGEPVQGLGI
jgi:hypothetical protein